MDRCCGHGRRGEDGGSRAWVLARKAGSACLGSSLTLSFRDPVMVPPLVPSVKGVTDVLLVALGYSHISSGSFLTCPYLCK